jgi:uncharacterized protein (TIRG00374 family)
MARGSRGGRRLTAGLGVISLMAFSAALSSGFRLGQGRHTSETWAVLAGQLVAGTLAVGFTWRRRRAGTDLEAVVDFDEGSSPGLNGADEPAVLSPRRRPRPWMAWSRRVLTMAALGVGALFLSEQWPTLQAALGHLGHLNARWLRWAILAEAGSMVFFAATQWVLLRSGGARFALGALIRLVLAGNALSVTLPAGPAWSASFSFQQLRSRGASRALSAYALGAAAVLSAVTFCFLLFIGVDLAGGSGPAASLRSPVTAAGAAFAVVALGAIIAMRIPAVRKMVARRLAPTRSASWRARVVKVARSFSDLHLSWRLLAEAFVSALFNWLGDFGCLVMCIVAVSGHVPWRGVLIAYGLGQLGASLPITPGGLGVAEGSLSLALMAYGMPGTSALAAVVLYRLISYWAVMGMGWAAFGTLTAGRRGRRGLVTTPRTEPVTAGMTP